MISSQKNLNQNYNAHRRWIIRMATMRTAQRQVAPREVFHRLAIEREALVSQHLVDGGGGLAQQPSLGRVDREDRQIGADGDDQVLHADRLVADDGGREGTRASTCA